MGMKKKIDTKKSQEELKKKKCHAIHLNPITKEKLASKKHTCIKKITKDEDLDFPEMDFIPSDSSEDLSEANLKKSKENNENLVEPKRQIYTDFTSNTVFVGNLPINYDKKKVVKFFSQFGKVISARIRCVPIANINMRKKVAAIKKEYNPHRRSLVAYVKYEAEDSVKAAVEANGMVLDGHHLRINLAEDSQKIDINKAIFVGGLPFDIEDDELWEFFENCGKIESVRVIRDSHTSMGKGIGYVNFDSTASVELALQMDGQELKKRIINVKRCLSTKIKKKSKAFGRQKTKEVVSELLSKKNKTKFKEEKKKLKLQPNKLDNDFLGKKASVKKKKRKKLSQYALQKKKIVKILGTS